MKISHSELIHHKIQAALREHKFDESVLKYIGKEEGEHWYLIDGKHKVPASSIEGFDRTDLDE